MPAKDDPLGASQRSWTDPRSGTTLWLEPETMSEAREAFYQAYRKIDPNTDEQTWTTAWAAAIAAFSYMMEGRTRPK